MTTRPLFSSTWYRVAPLRPRIRQHARIYRQQYRWQIWYVVEDRISERFYRFSPQAYLIIGLMDGTRTVQEIWDVACERLGDDAPTQDETIHLLAQLHASDVLQCDDVTPDAAELFERYQKQRRRRGLGHLLSVFSWRVPLFDPELMLRWFVPVLRPFAGWLGTTIWLLVVMPAIILLALHWRDFTQNIGDQVFSAQSLMVLWVLFPVIKALHEFGHAFLTKAYGGEVHDMGVMILVFMPVPYVDASSAWAFSEKWRRIAVGAAGMLVELFIASLAVFVWVNAEPGLVRSMAFSAILIAGISTLLFNANPLLRFDGYYMLSDWLEIPNLWQRAHRYLGYLCERYGFGRRDAEPPQATAGERAWFVLYAVSSFIYRALVVVAILMFLGHQYFYLAVFFAFLTAVGWVGVPATKGIAYLFTSPRIRKVRVRAITITAGAIVVAIYFLGFVPVPYRSRAEGVTWIPEESFVRAATEGFIEHLVARPGERVGRGEVLLVLRDAPIVARVAELEARRRELLARYDEERPVDLVKAEILRDELAFINQTLGEARQRVRELTIRAGAAGTFVVSVPEDMPGRFVKRGELVGYVVELATVIVRVIVPQGQIDLVQHDIRGVDVRLAERLLDPLPGEVRRIVPAATEELPTTALGSEGGGKVAVDPRDTRGVTALDKVFQVDIELPTAARLLNVGGRAYVRFDHGRRPLAQQWYREIRQLFLERFNV